MGLSKMALEKQNRDLKTQIENLKAKLEMAREELKSAQKQFEAESKKKDKTIAMLQAEIENRAKEIGELKKSQAETMRERIDGAVSIAVAQAVAPLVEELTKAHVEIGRLKAIINKDSGNSSKPPSQNGFKDVPNSREKSNRPRGGQKGHPGHRLALPENMDELVEKGIVESRIVDHTDGVEESVSRYVIDLEVTTTITEHRYPKDAALPEELLNEVSYGENLKALSVLLLSEGIIAEKRLADMIGGLTRGVVTMSPATLEGFQATFADKLERGGELEAIEEDLLNGEVMNTDDTPMKSSESIEYLEDGGTKARQATKKSFRVTIRTHSNERSTLYTANPKKDEEGIRRDNILTRFVGILGHDHESKFYNYGSLHSTCGEHLVRDLIGLRDLECVPWADEMRKHMLEMNRHKNNDLAGGRTACEPEILESFEKGFDRLMERGRAAHEQMAESELGYKGFNAMLNRLTEYKDCYFLFIRNYKAPFTNNLAERDLRMEKTKGKVSGLFRSWQGVKRHTKIRSFLSTIKKRKKDLFSAITDVFKEIPVLR